jgi:peptide-methionine (S)-S-oxide reductase
MPGMNRFSLVLAALAGVAACIMMSQANDENPPAKKPAAAPAAAPGQELATLGAGCFWCVEAVLQRLDGVVAVTSGYMGGKEENPTYEQVCTGRTGHAEVVQVVFDPKKLSYARLLEWFWQLHDPTQKDGQGGDIGPQYRSVVFFHSPEQKSAAEAAKLAAQPGFPKPIVTEISPAGRFWPAEEYHQDYYQLNKNRNPYCPAVITPKLRKLGIAD